MDVPRIRGDWKYFIHPTLRCYPLDKVAKGIAIINMVSSACCLAVIVAFHFVMLLFLEDLKAPLDEVIDASHLSPHDHFYAHEGVPLLLAFVNIMAMMANFALFGLGKFLYTNVEQGNYENLRRWLEITIVALCLTTMFNITLVQINSKRVSFYIFEGLNVIYGFYSLWAVREYMVELQPSLENPNEATYSFSRL